MDFKDYQNKTHDTYTFGNLLQAYICITHGLPGEVGELMEKLKKVHRDKNGVFEYEDKEEISGEIGDILWYLSEFCTLMGLSLNQIAEGNLKKLEDRQKREVLQGSGDNR
jgi:NTP pyrophosphatase (non-canonical NTP hydrolase)